MLVVLYSTCATYVAIPHVFFPRSIRTYPLSPHLSPENNSSNLIQTKINFHLPHVFLHNQYGVPDSNP